MKVLTNETLSIRKKYTAILENRQIAENSLQHVLSLAIVVLKTHFVVSKNK